MELEEAIDNVKFIIGDLKASNYNKTFIQAIETVLQALENSIPKKKIEEKIDELKKEKYILSSRDAEIRLLQELLEEK